MSFRKIALLASLALLACQQHAQAASAASALDYLLHDGAVLKEQLVRGLTEDAYADSEGNDRVRLHATAAQRNEIYARLAKWYPTADTVSVLEKAVAFDGGRNNAYLLARLAVRYGYQDDQQEKAAQTAEKALRQSGTDDGFILSQYVSVMINVGRVGAAVPRIERLAAGDPGGWSPLVTGVADAIASAMEEMAEEPTTDSEAWLRDAADMRIGLLEIVRKLGRLDAMHYMALANAYGEMEGKDRAAIAAVEDGLAKGILPASAEVYNSLAPLYHFAGDRAKAIAIWQEWAPRSRNGVSSLNLGKALFQEGRDAEAKRAVQAALDKGGLKESAVAEARRLLAR